MEKTSIQLPHTDLVVVTGPTASGKTGFAAMLASHISGEIISADSRQVYKGMDLGTGKDYQDYQVEDQLIPYHLIDITDPGNPYNVYTFQNDFLKTYKEIHSRNKMPILCGGTGLYIEAVLKGYRLIEVPPDLKFREAIHDKPDAEIIEQLASVQNLHNESDTTNRKRMIRALEIARYYKKHPHIDHSYPHINYKILGVRFDRESERKRITSRLRERLENGMVDEVRNLLDRYGFESVEYFGLEYKFISWYIRGKISYEEMFSKLNTAIHQFAKRQMTWFRRMQRNGFEIHWIDGYTPLDKKIDQAIAYLERN